MREMRLKKREITDQATLREIVEKSAVVRIGVADEDGIFVIPLNFGYDWTIKKTGEPEWKIYIHSAQKGRKADAFRKDIRRFFQRHSYFFSPVRLHRNLRAKISSILPVLFFVHRYHNFCHFFLCPVLSIQKKNFQKSLFFLCTDRNI